MRCRRVGARLLLAAAVAALAVACQTTGTRKHAAAQQAQAFFWEAQSPEGGKLFLLGSVHIGDGREVAFDPRIETAWQTSQELVVELDTNSTSPVDAVQATNRHGALPAPHTLKEIVRADTYKQVADYMKQRDYSMDRVDQSRPWFVALIVQDLEYSAAGLKSDNFVDAALLRRAKDHKPVVALTTLDEQMATFASLPDALQETWLVDQLRDTQNLRAVTSNVLAAWEAGDDAQMTSLLFPDAGNPEQAEFYDRFYANRNQVMSERLAALEVDQKPRFVALGAGYLLGAHGIPELLAQRGFTVHRIGGVAKVVGPPTAVARATIPAPPQAVAPAPTPAPPAAVAPAAPPVATVPAAPSAPPVAIATPTPSAALVAPAAAAAPAPPAVTPQSAPTPQAVAQPASSPAPTAAAPAAATAPRPRGDPHDQWLAQDAPPPGGAQPAPAASPPPPAPVAPAPPPAPNAQPKSAPAKSASTTRSASAAKSASKTAAKKTPAPTKSTAKKTTTAKSGAKNAPAKQTPTTAKKKPAAKKKSQTAPANQTR